MNLKKGDKLICIKCDDIIAPNEVVEIEEVLKEIDVLFYRFKGYKRAYSERAVNKMFKFFNVLVK